MREEKLARAFVEFSDTLVRDYDVVEFLSRLCRRSVEVLEVTAAGALLTDGAKRLQVVAASTETVTVLETLQIQRQEGPCVDAFRSGRRVAVPDLRPTARRWPVFTPRALGAGVAGVCAFPMRLRADRIGALNVFQATPGALDEAAVLAGQALADVATIAILQARAVEDAARLAGQLEHALESRVVVEQAKGILAERLGIDPEVAFTRLRRHCRQHGLHLAELARQVVGGSFTLDQETGQEGLAAAVDGNPVGVGSFPRSAGRPRPGARDGPATAHWDCP